MTLRRLKWFSVLMPVLFLGAVEFLRQSAAPSVFQAWPGRVLLAGVVLLGALFFTETVFGFVGRLQARLTQQNRELLALHDAGLGILGELDLEAVLQQVVNRARDLVGARYGALSLLQPGGGIEAFLTAGISAEERARLGPLPTGHGILGVVLAEGQPLRLRDLTRDPRSVGVPLDHPPMRSLLAVPIVSHGHVLGNLYLTEKEGAPEFDADDEETLLRFATQAALAIENARLHGQVRVLAITEERERIAREMHDSLAQVLGYVNTKAQAAQALLEQGKEEKATAQIGQLAAAVRAAYADVREGILGLRATPAVDRSFIDTLRDYLDQWQTQSDISVDLVTDPATGFTPNLTPNAEVQLLRILQEALANVRKHAATRRVVVRLTRSPDLLEAIVEDDGAGFLPAAIPRTALPRFGLATMRERAEAVGGSFSLTSAPGRGTRVVVRLPSQQSPVWGGGRARARADRG